MNTENIAWAEAKIAEKEAEIADLRAYIRVAKAKADSVMAEQHPIAGAFAAASESLTRGAKKRAILKSLLNVPSAETGWIVPAIGIIGITGATVENTSPQLSAYKAEGLVSLTDGRWAITQKGRDYLADKN